MSARTNRLHSTAFLYAGLASYLTEEYSLFFLTVAGRQAQQTSPGRTGREVFPSILHSLDFICVCYFLTLSTTVKRTASSLQLKDKGAAGGWEPYRKGTRIERVRTKWHCEMKLSGRKENNSTVAAAKGRFSPHYPHPQDYEQPLSCPQPAHGHKLFPPGEECIQFIKVVYVLPQVCFFVVVFLLLVNKLFPIEKGP